MTEETPVTTTDENVDATPAEETTETVDTEEVEAEPTETSDAEGEDAEAEEQKLDPRDRKLAELAYKEREQRRQLRQMERLLEKQIESQAKSNAPKEPRLEDFDTIDEYIDAKLEYRDSVQKQPTQETAPVNQDYDDIDFSLSVDELYGNGIAKHPDFAEVVGGDHARITPEMATTIFTIDDPDLQVDTAYYLGNNPKEAARIAKLPPVRQIAEVTRLADKMLLKRTPKEKPKSKAPEPIKPVGGSKTVSNELRDGMSFEDFMKVRNKQLGRG